MDSAYGKKPLWVMGLSFAALALLASMILWAIVQKQLKYPFHVTQRYLAPQISSFLNKTGKLPAEILVPVFMNDEERQIAKINSTIREDYSQILQKYLQRYKPDHGVIAVMNPDTGAILALESFSKEDSEEDNAGSGHLGLRAAFPAASVFKIVTATAAIDQGKAYSETVISYNGRNHTLYRKHVKDRGTHRETNHVTLREAFGRSINTVFGKLGLFHVGFQDLQKYADAFYFNREIPSDLLIEKSRFIIDPSDTWQLVESSAGFTHRTTLSPIHGAMIASAILNEGRMKAPYVIQNLMNEKGKSLYEHEIQPLGEIMSGYSARQMHLLMEETITSGTSRKPFRGLAHEDSELILGGKTGSLDGKMIKGRTDWFVGYASHNDLRLAVGIVTVHKKYWTVKSSMLARLFFEDVFDRSVLVESRHSNRREKSRSISLNKNR
jgi:cell division protein FtsI/penicillin-binding protein 2